MSNTQNHKKSFEKNCSIFYKDLFDCINLHNVHYKRGEFLHNDHSKQEYFDFTKCEQYKKLFFNSKINFIKYRPNDIVYPYNHYYEIKFINGELELKFTD